MSIEKPSLANKNVLRYSIANTKHCSTALGKIDIEAPISYIFVL
jgi:hypothetical protein